VNGSLRAHIRAGGYIRVLSHPFVNGIELTLLRIVLYRYDSEKICVCFIVGLFRDYKTYSKKRTLWKAD